MTLFLKAVGAGSRALCAARARRRRAVPRAARPAVHAPAGRRPRPCSSPAATASRPSASWARRLRGSGRARGSSTAGAARPTCRCCRRLQEPRHPGRPGHGGRQPRRARPRDGSARGAPRRRDRPGAALRLRAGGDDARRRADRRARAIAGRGQPRPLDGLRHRHLPRLRRARAGRRTRRGPSTAAPAPRARCSTRRASSGRATRRPARAARRPAGEARGRADEARRRARPACASRTR